MSLISIVVPIKDERENILPLVEDIRRAMPTSMTWEVVFVDDGSLDDSFQRLCDLCAHDSRIKVLRLGRNFGQSSAMQAGIDHAQGDIIVTMDGDRQNDPADIPLLVEKLNEGYDAVLGQRAKRQDALLIRKLPSMMANWLIRKVTRVTFRDFGCTLRAMRRDLVQSFRLYGEMHRFISVLASQQGAKITQLPVKHHPRTEGKSKYGLSRTFRVILDLLTVKFLNGYLTRPMHFFGGAGLVLMMVGILSLSVTLAMKFVSGVDMSGNPMLMLSVLLEIAGVQFLSTGLLGELLMRTYFESQDKRAYTVRETRNVNEPPDDVRKAG